MLRLKSGVGVTVFGKEMQQKVQEHDFFVAKDPIFRIERHCLPLVIAPQNEISVFRIWTFDPFETF